MKSSKDKLLAVLLIMTLGITVVTVLEISNSPVNWDGQWRVGLSIDTSTDLGENMTVKLISDDDSVVEKFRTWKGAWQEERGVYQYYGMSKSNWTMKEILTFRWVWYDNSTGEEVFNAEADSFYWTDVWGYGTSLIHYVNGNKDWALFICI